MSTDPCPLPRGLALPARLMELLVLAAGSAASRTIEARRRRRRPKRGLTLQPGPDTPLWNELVRQVAPHLRMRGSKAQLARLLGLPRQRLQVCLKAQAGCFDAERTLMLLAWLAARAQGVASAPRPLRDMQPKKRQ